MNGQLNGFHEVFIEEGTFLFTSESVGEGHPGAGRARLGGAAIAQARPGVGGHEEDEGEDEDEGSEDEDGGNEDGPGAWGGGR